ncbi:SAM hydrolase/SAM-dependent halogenase family protein [Streptosporangium sandarakinum]
MTSVITILTDYGLQDGYVASCHGVIVGISPEARIIDVCHQVPTGDVRRAAAILAQTVPHMPPAVHIAVVDPGGGARRAVAIEAGDHVFLGPDNGVLSWAVQANGGARAAYELTNEELFRRPVAPTFHGRDVFAPVAAFLTIGRRPPELGPPIPLDRLVSLPAPTSRVREGTVEGEVLSVDGHGNTQLSVTGGDLDTLGARPGGTLVVWLGRRHVTVPFRETFAAVAPGELVAFTDSAGLLSLAVHAGDASQRLGLPPGAHVRLSVHP